MSARDFKPKRTPDSRPSLMRRPESSLNNKLLLLSNSDLREKLPTLQLTKLRELLLRRPQLLELRNKPETSRSNNSRMRSNDFTERDAMKSKKLLKLKQPLKKLNEFREKRRLRLDVFRLSERPSKRTPKLRLPDKKLLLLVNRLSSLLRRREISPPLKKLPEREQLLLRPLKLRETRPSKTRSLLERPRMRD